MQTDSPKARRVRVALGVYRQDGALFASYREPGGGRARFAKLTAETIRDAKKERESLLSALREGDARPARRSRSRRCVGSEAKDEERDPAPVANSCTDSPRVHVCK
jgi:hypothetical protein